MGSMAELLDSEPFAKAPKDLVEDMRDKALEEQYFGARAGSLWEYFERRLQGEAMDARALPFGWVSRGDVVEYEQGLDAGEVQRLRVLSRSSRLLDAVVPKVGVAMLAFIRVDEALGVRWGFSRGSLARREAPAMERGGRWAVRPNIRDRILAPFFPKQPIHWFGRAQL